MSSTQLISFFEERRKRGSPMVLVTVIETAGSTYSKVGARMLIDEDCAYHGLVSGGCLEGDLVEHARKVLRTHVPETITYDLRTDHDDLWGLGVGCDGLIQVLLQPLTADTDYQPMRALLEAVQTDSLHLLTLITQSSHPDLAIGSTLVAAATMRGGMGKWGELLGMLQSSVDTPEAGPGVVRHGISLNGYPLVILQQLLRPVPRILVLGAGADAVPVVEGFNTLGWRVEVGDHREATLAHPAFANASRLLLSDDACLQRSLRERPPTAIILMTHNLQRDLRYLKLLAWCDCVYLGVLGPSRRRDRLIGALDPTTRSRLSSRLKGPVGLNIGADSPASIALSIVTEVFTEVKRSLTSVPVAETGTARTDTGLR